MNYLCRVSLLLWFALGTLGCGRAYDAQVSGTVRMNGQLMNRGIVSYYPAAQGPAAVGSIRPDGTYAISTGRGVGLVPGDYLVTVFANEPPPADESLPGKVITPAIYGDKATTPLQFTIKPGANIIDLTITGTPP